jgi:hypothetical protein
MRDAVDKSGSPVRAGADAPCEALCPRCGGPMVLRIRRRSSRPGDVTYFWRHKDNINLDCQARFSAAQGGDSNGRLRMR